MNTVAAQSILNNLLTQVASHNQMMATLSSEARKLRDANQADDHVMELHHIVAAQFNRTTVAIAMYFHTGFIFGWIKRPDSPYAQIVFELLPLKIIQDDKDDSLNESDLENMIVAARQWQSQQGID